MAPPARADEFRAGPAALHRVIARDVGRGAPGLTAVERDGDVQVPDAVVIGVLRISRCRAPDEGERRAATIAGDDRRELGERSGCRRRRRPARPSVVRGRQTSTRLADRDSTPRSRRDRRGQTRRRGTGRRSGRRHRRREPSARAKSVRCRRSPLLPERCRSAPVAGRPDMPPRFARKRCSAFDFEVVASAPDDVRKLGRVPMPRNAVRVEPADHWRSGIGRHCGSLERFS